MVRVMDTSDPSMDTVTSSINQATATTLSIGDEDGEKNKTEIFFLIVKLFTIFFIKL